MFMSYTVCYFTGIFYAIVMQISMLFIDNKDSVFWTSARQVRVRNGLTSSRQVHVRDGLTSLKQVHVRNGLTSFH